jgi:hypothetical protein
MSVLRRAESIGKAWTDSRVKSILAAPGSRTVHGPSVLYGTRAVKRAEGSIASRSVQLTDRPHPPSGAGSIRTYYDPLNSKHARRLATVRCAEQLPEIMPRLRCADAL